MMKLLVTSMTMLLARAAARLGAAAPDEPQYTECAAIAAELEFARLEIASLQHDNELLASENKILANERNLPEVLADIREYISHVVDGDDVVPCRQDKSS
mmetsp:Transcript_4346/g.12853  ORF Transcript_4346/g.12853 Transcript_4346/m.12853 type:complete len:100 (-) Transcript_4346:63-362(-)